MRLNGTITIGGEALQKTMMNPSAFLSVNGLYLSNGLMIHSWIVGPTMEVPYGVPAFATVWHPNGLHEVVPVDSTSNASDIWTSNFSGKKYFNNFVFGLSARNASLNIKQIVINGDVSPLPGTQGYNISEAYGQGEGVWDGEEVQFFGHVEQLSEW
ncbi:MAG: hypothetical protein M1834_008780 [Cirrosporium novae-zelandiae]|nr:MAG: hypothetical protein M1834_008780 [Cirrosporium novae-zelandiae]